MSFAKIALYRASLLADNLGIRLCAAALMVMPSALVFLWPVLAVLGAPDDGLLPGGPVGGAGVLAPVLPIALGVGFAAAWARIACTAPRLVRRPSLRRFVGVGLGVGIVALVVDLARRQGGGSEEEAGWLLLASLVVSLFLLAGTLGLPRTDRLHRV